MSSSDQFYLFERAIDLMPRNVEKTAFLIDMGGKRKHSTPIGLAKDWVSVLQSCYPGALQRLLTGLVHVAHDLARLQNASAWESSPMLLGH